VYLTVDTGHQAGAIYGAAGDDLRYTAWLERFASVCEIVHIQQTAANASAHWPFTEEHNQRGHVRIEDVLSAIERSHRLYNQHPFAGVLPPVKRTILVVEYIPGSTVNEETVLDSLKKTSTYLRKFIPEGGITFQVE